MAAQQNESGDLAPHPLDGFLLLLGEICEEMARSEAQEAERKTA